ncbi:hypothetical protein NJC40_17085 [Pseudomonas sp. 21LCFQ02]|uniref:hypothetical protein n=1 Tax=unclassified Pseudomonas TaxID=196821 RepID=UPI0004F5E030|nr:MULTISPECIES: hypothetical protein [unclassified Pseudomonas]MCO8164906.1 hypothetical protein [Pseudomonas sp. 21LCFQ010]MCO8169481.1 hypothetical protein [Pseudomonas sp. 21LCFQ02]MCQ9422865.1 hypothetical protein [Pseudomonas sp. LJDD11]BAP45319.1 putative uncharacterized protein [Pseudomonas sp. StFLB209]
MSLPDLLIPDAVKTEAIQILADIERADGVLEMSRLAGVAEGFTLGLACSQGLAQAELDTLERVFSSSVSRRMAVLRSQA